MGPAGLGAAVAKMPWPLALRLLEEVAKFGALEALEALEDGEINGLGALKYGYWPPNPLWAISHNGLG